MRFLPIFALTLATATAGPVLELEKRQGTCGANNIALRVLRGLGPRGSIFCNQVLALPTSVIVSNLPAPVTTVTVPSPSITGLCELTEAKRDLSDGAAKRDAEAEAEALEKRQAIPALSLFAGRQITAGCSCLSLAPRTVTSRVTPEVITATITEGVIETCGPEARL